MKYAASCLVFSISLSLCAPAAAQVWIPMLKNTPAERFDEEDLKLFLDAARRTLNEAPDNQPVTWENPATKHGGELTVLRTFEWQGRPCKEVRVRHHAAGRKSDNTSNLCRVEGKWRLVSASQLKKK
jgi:surface antigen